MQNEKIQRQYPDGERGTEREYPGDTGRSRPSENPGRTQDHTSVRPKDTDEEEAA
jgi:hypothetical protein